MKIDDAMETIAKFFNDLIGALVPGMVFAAGLGVEHVGPDATIALIKAMDSTPLFLIALAVMFALGYVLGALFEAVSVLRTKAVERLPTRIRAKLPASLRLPKGFNRAEAETRESYIDFSAIVAHARANSLPTPTTSGMWNYNDLRNVAMSVSSEAAAVARRFMFDSLLCNGVGTGMVLLALDFAGCLYLKPRLLQAYPVTMNATMQIVLLVLVAMALFQRGQEFFRRSMTTPFSMAVAEIRLKGTPAGSP